MMNFEKEIRDYWSGAFKDAYLYVPREIYLRHVATLLNHIDWCTKVIETSDLAQEHLKWSPRVEITMTPEQFKNEYEGRFSNEPMIYGICKKHQLPLEYSHNGRDEHGSFEVFKCPFPGCKENRTR